MKVPLAAVIMCLLALTLSSADARPRVDFRRGVSVHTMLNWARLAPGDPSRYAADPFAGPEYELPDALIRNVREAGFDFVRLTIDPGPFLQLQGAPRAALDRKLVATVRRFLDADLAVIVDFHSNTHVPAYDPVNWLTSADNPIFRRYVALVGHTASLLAELKTRSVAIEPMNEPVYGYDPAGVARWQDMAEMMHKAVRSVTADLLVVLSGARGGNRLGLEAFDPAPFRGSRVLYSFHYYEPYPFTHEGVVSNQTSAAMWRYFSAMPYPANSLPAAVVFDTIKANINADTTLDPSQGRGAWAEARPQVAQYLKSGFDRRSIAEAFDGVTAWAARHHVDPRQIFLGEFGVTRTYGIYRAADPVSRDGWLTDVVRAAERRDFGWCLWSLSGYGGMALVAEDGGTTLDQGTLRALGLKTLGETIDLDQPKSASSVNERSPGRGGFGPR